MNSLTLVITSNNIDKCVMYNILISLHWHGPHSRVSSCTHVHHSHLLPPHHHSPAACLYSALNWLVQPFQTVFFSLLQQIRTDVVGILAHRCLFLCFLLSRTMQGPLLHTLSLLLMLILFLLHEKHEIPSHLSWVCAILDQRDKLLLVPRNDLGLGGTTHTLHQHWFRQGLSLEIAHLVR